MGLTPAVLKVFEVRISALCVASSRALARDASLQDVLRQDGPLHTHSSDFKVWTLIQHQGLLRLDLGLACAQQLSVLFTAL